MHARVNLIKNVYYTPLVSNSLRIVEKLPQTGNKIYENYVPKCNKDKTLFIHILLSYIVTLTTDTRFLQ